MSSSNWWADRLGTQRPAAPQQNYPPTQQPGQAPPPNGYMPNQVQQMPPEYLGQQQQPQGWSAQATPLSSQTDTTCPSCRSNNYALVGKVATQNGTVEARRCYNCGFPVVQAGSGMSGLGNSHSAGPTKAAKQVPTGGYNPQGIIGRL